MFNLKQRQEKERKTLNELINLGDSEEKLRNIQSIIHNLESAFLEIDDTLILFTEF